MTLLTRKMYQIDPPEIVTASKSGEDFYEFFLSSIPPDMYCLLNTGFKFPSSRRGNIDTSQLAKNVKSIDAKAK